MYERADQIVLDYLRQVGDVAYQVLRSDERLDFMTRLRARIEEIQAQTGAREPEEVRKVIARFGDPARLVERERRRLEQERLSQEQVETETPIARVATGEPVPESEPSTQPIPVVADSTPPDQRAEPARDQPAPTATARDQAAPTEGTQADAGTRGGEAPRTGTPGGARPPAAQQPTGAPGRQSPGGTVRPPSGGPPTYQETTTSPSLPGMPGLGDSTSRFDWRALVSEHRLETAAILLLGLGGLVAPFPYVLIPLLVGAGFALFASAWPARDKLLGLAAPVAFFVLGVFVTGAATRSERVVVDLSAYGAALTGYGMTFIRVGALIGASYLTWQLIRRAAGPEPPATGRPPGRTAPPRPPGPRVPWRREPPWSR